MKSSGPGLTVEIDLETDQLLTLGQARNLFPKPPSLNTMWRWRTKGINGVKLPAVKCGPRWLTAKNAIREFIRLQTVAVQPVTTESGTRTSQVTRDLQAAGLLKETL